MAGVGRVHSISHLCCLNFETNSSLPGQRWKPQENELVQPTLHARTAMGLGPALLDEPRKTTSPSECVLMHLLKKRVVSECGLGYCEAMHALKSGGQLEAGVDSQST